MRKLTYPVVYNYTSLTGSKIDKLKPRYARLKCRTSLTKPPLRINVLKFSY
jgi:hypothetical protein